MPALQSGPAQPKITFHHQPPDLRVKLRHLALVLRIGLREMLGEHLGRRFQQRLLPGLNLVGLDPETCGQLRSCRVVAERRKSTFAWNAGSCFRRFADIFCLLGRAVLAGILEGRIHLSQWSKSRGQSQIR